MLHVGQQARRFITGGLHDLTVQTRKRLLHKRMPRGVSTAVGRLLQDDGGALGVHRHQAQPAGTGCILGQGDGFGGHVLCPPCACLLAIPHERLLHLTVDLLLGAIGGADKAVKARAGEQETHQANATSTDLDTDQVDGQDQARQEGEARDALEKRDDGGTFIEAFVVRPPGRQGTAGDLKDLRRVTLGETLSLQGAIPLKQTRAFDAIPALVTSIVASLRLWDDCAHSDLLCPPFALVSMLQRMARSLVGFHTSWWRVTDGLEPSATPSGRRRDRCLTAVTQQCTACPSLAAAGFRGLKPLWYNSVPP